MGNKALLKLKSAINTAQAKNTPIIPTSSFAHHRPVGPHVPPKSVQQAAHTIAHEKTYLDSRN